MSRKRREPPADPDRLFPLIDAHTHLAACGGRDPASVTAILDRAESVGVARVVTVADDMVDARWAVDASDWDVRAYAAVALHPTHAGDLDEAAKVELEEMARRPRTVAVGETGLDYYWIGKDPDTADKATQAQSFAWHIDLAKRVGKPLMIHNREADEDLLDILAAEGDPDTVIMHCFSGDADIARECVRRGYYLSFAGTVTFTNAASLQEAAREVPLSQILVETDAPFLTPHPFRGAPNQSYVLPYTVRGLARILGVDEQVLADAVTANACDAYSIPLPT